MMTVATTLGSLGLPIYLHTCRMLAMQVEMEDAGCPMCSGRDSSLPVVPASGQDESGGCCDDAIVHQRTDPGTMARAEMPMPLFVGIVLLFAVDASAAAGPVLTALDVGDSPPGLAARARQSYLLNSTFLI